MEEQREFSLQDIDYYGMVIHVIKNSWVMILAVVASMFLIQWYHMMTYTPEYTSSATFAVRMRSSSQLYSDDLSAVTAVVNTFQDVFQSDLMKHTVADKLGVEELEMRVQASVVSETNLLTVQVTSNTQEQAYHCLRALIEIYPTLSETVFGDAVLQTISYPSIPYHASNRVNVQGMIRRAAQVICVGMLLLIGLLYCLRDTVMTESVAKKQIDAKLLGTLNQEAKNKTMKAKLKKINKSVLITNPGISFYFTESIQKMTMRISFQMKRHQCKTLMVTSVSENEGKTTVAANIALSLAKAGNKVLFMEGDYRKPAVDRIMDLHKEPYENYYGALMEEKSVEECLYYDEKKGIHLLLTTASDDSMKQVYSKERLQTLMKECRELFDFVIVDSPPFAGMVDAEEMANIVDASVLVIKKNKVKIGEINDVIDLLENRNATMLGYVLNRVSGFSLQKAHSYGYGKYGRYEKYITKQQ